MGTGRGKNLTFQTKLLLVLAALALVSVVTIASLSINSILHTGETAKEASGGTLRAQIEESLTQFILSSALQTDLELEAVRQDVAVLAHVAEQVLRHPEQFPGGAYWSADERIVRGEAGQHYNLSSDTSEVFLPNFVRLSTAAKTAVEQLALLDLVYVPIYHTDPKSAAVWFIGEGEFIRHYPYHDVWKLLRPDFVPTVEFEYSSAGPVENPEGGIIWSDLYDDEAGLGLMVSAMSPVFGAQDDFAGVIGIDITLERLTARYEEAGPIGEGYWFLVSDDGRALAQPDQAYEDILGRTRQPDEFGTDLTGSTTAFAPILGAMTNGETGFESVLADDQELFVAYAPVSSTGWSLGYVAQAAVLTQSVADLQSSLDASTSELIWQRIVPAGIIILLASLSVGFWMTRRLTNPIHQLAAAAEAFGKGEWGHRLPPAGNDEIGALTNAFARMATQIRTGVEELERRVAARTRKLSDANDELRSINSVILRWDKNGVVTFLNDFGLQLFGFAKDEIVGKPLLETIVPDTESTGRSLTTMIEEILEMPEKYANNENETIKKNGDLVWIAWRNKPITNEDGSLREILTIGIDITERKASEQRFASVTESANDAIISSDSSSTIVSWNQAAVDMFGWNPEEVIGQPVETIIPDRYHESHKAGMDRVTNTAETRVIGGTVELQARHREGHEFPIEMSLAAWKVGTDQFYTGIFRDITERKQMEAELEKARSRMEDELNVGREIQMSMLPLMFPAFPQRHDFSVYATLVPAREVGGDFYDFFLIDEKHLCVCVGDVSGKGVPAALFMAVTKALIQSRASDNLSPASIMAHVNDEICRQNEASMFVTVFMGILSLDTGDFVYSNAGHNPPYIKRQDGSVTKLAERHGPVVGAKGGLAYGQGSDRMALGDLLLLYTDGVTEAMNAEKELYGEDRLVELLESGNHKSAETLVQSVAGDVTEFEAGAEQADDVTLLALQYFGEANQEGLVLTLQIEVENRLEEIARVNREFNEFAEAHSIAVSTRRSINLVFDELLNNIVSYAFQDDDLHMIYIRIEIAGHRLGVTIRDTGSPFDPFAQAAPDTSLSLDEREIGGLGIHLVTNVMDEVSYDRLDDSNVVTLVKYLPTDG
jgi:sigma-B regulation protein RsbU (phosphoserine phosphatase)